MQRILTMTAVITALLLTFTGCGKTKDSSTASEIDLTSQLVTTTTKAEDPSSAEETTTTTTTVTETEAPEETEEPEEEEEDESSEEEEEEESVAETEPEEVTPQGHSEGETIFQGKKYSFKTYNDTWENYNDKIKEMQENMADDAAAQGLDANAANFYDAIYTYVPDSTQRYISNFDVMISDYGDLEVSADELKQQFESEYNSMGGGISIVSSEVSSFNGISCVKIAVTIPSGDLTLKRLSYAFMYDQHLYQVSMTSTDDRFDKVEPAFNEVISTFSFS